MPPTGKGGKGDCQIPPWAHSLSGFMGLTIVQKLPSNPGEPGGSSELGGSPGSLTPAKTLFFSLMVNFSKMILFISFSLYHRDFTIIRFTGKLYAKSFPKTVRVKKTGAQDAGLLAHHQPEPVSQHFMNAGILIHPGYSSFYFNTKLRFFQIPGV